MGGERGVKVTLPAALHALELNSDLSICLVGDKSQIQPYLKSTSSALLDRIQVVHTLDVVRDEDNPSHVLRNGKLSSMYMAVELLQSERVEAMVSAGNTGALLMIGRHLLKTISGIQRPAIVVSIPGATRQCFLLDVGANLECSAQQLFEFAVMGSVLAESLQGEVASVGLLNIGSEQFKGTDDVREAGLLLMRILSDQINPHRFNGASLLGLKGSIIKSHGNATIEGFAYAIQQAVREAENAVPELIRGKVAAIIAAS
jgi:phosphate acyltransferase